MSFEYTIRGIYRDSKKTESDVISIGLTEEMLGFFYPFFSNISLYFKENTYCINTFVFSLITNPYYYYF